MEEKKISYDCLRGCATERSPQGELICEYDTSCCKLSVFNWLDNISQKDVKDLFEVRFKNTRKLYYQNTSGQIIKEGDLVVVEATTGHDVGIVTLQGAMVALQMKRHNLDYRSYEFRKIYRKAKALDIERWQEAIAREHTTMIRSRQIAAEMGLNMKIGDVEFQGDGTKAIFYYIADERVDFRQLIKVFAEQFRIRIEMKQIGARQEAGLIGGLGVCGRALCCSNYISSFHSITTQAARCQDLSLNPQKLAGQCSKLKCCINYEAAVYTEAHSKMPHVNAPLELEDGDAYLVKTNVLKDTMWFSYEKGGMTNIIPLNSQEVRNILHLNRKGIKAASIKENGQTEKVNEFVTAVGDDKIDRFDKEKKRKGGSNNKKHHHKKPNRKPNNQNNG